MLNRKVAVITGAPGGLGLAVVKKFRENDARICAVSGHEKEIRSAFGADSESFLGVEADVTSESAVRKAMDLTVAKFGRIDILIHLVGGFGMSSVEETPLEEIDKMYKINFLSCFLCCKHALPGMKKNNWGRIITIGAKGALSGAGGMAAYTASKAAVLNLTQALAEEGKKSFITANCLLPSIIDTPANRSSMPGSDFSSWVAPETLAATMLFLCSEEGRNTTGAAIPVFGRV